MSGPTDQGAFTKANAKVALDAVAALEERKAQDFDDSINRLPRPYQQRIAARYSGEKISSGARAAEVIGQVRSSPEALRKLVASLSVMERAALNEVARQGGFMDGWDLHVFLRLRDLRGDPRVFGSPKGRVGDFSVSEFTGAAALWELLTGGLLLPEALPNVWMQSYYSQFEPLGRLPSRVLLDPRLRPLLPPEPAPPITAPPTEVPAAPGQTDLTPLRLLEVLRGVRLHPLAVTKTGTISRASLKNLARSVTAVDDLEGWVIAGLNLGLMIREGDRVTVTAQAERHLTTLDPAQLRAVLSGPSGHVHPEDARVSFNSVTVVRRLLGAVLRALPHATTQAEVIRLTRLVTPPELLGSRPGQSARPDALDRWVAVALRGQLSAAGLVHVSGEGPDSAVTPAHLMTPPAPSGPAWILQPNFDLLVYPANLTPQQWPLLAAAEAARFDGQTASYRLTRQSVYAALESGLSLPDLLAGLQAGSATPLAPGVQRSLEDWAARRDRLTLHRNVSLLEYPTPAERGAALKKLGGTPVGERFLLPAGTDFKLPSGTPVLLADGSPTQTFSFNPDGSFRAEGSVDLHARGLLRGRVTTRPDGRLELRPTAPGGLPASFLPDLEARVKGRLPGALRLQLGVWSGQTPPPSLASVALLSHPQAAALAAHPRLKGLIGPVIGPNLFTVDAANVDAVRRALDTLGLSPTTDLTVPENRSAELTIMDDTRQKRAFLERAIEAGQRVLVQYNVEKYVGWSGNPTAGRSVLEEIEPLSIERGSGNTPYLNARLVGEPGKGRGAQASRERHIRIQYVTGMALR